jgi:hypothetical protein
MKKFVVCILFSAIIFNSLPVIAQENTINTVDDARRGGVIGSSIPHTNLISPENLLKILVALFEKNPELGYTKESYLALERQLGITDGDRIIIKRCEVIQALLDAGKNL